MSHLSGLGAAEPWDDPVAEAFLRAGPPPVFLSLGSLEQIAPERARALLAGAARESGLRCMLQFKSDRRGSSTVDGQALTIGRAPHARVFERCAAIVHHGGAGTVHTAAAAGVPSLVVAFVDEQRDWGRRLAAAGAGHDPLSFWKVTPRALASAMRRLVEHEALGVTARALAQRLRLEDGVSRACQVLEELAGRG